MMRRSIGRKIIVAVTGLLLFGFLVGHMAGNLFTFQGPDALNSYAEKLKSTGPLLWVARLGLLAILAVHIYFTILLTIENSAARPERYMVVKPRRSTFASLSMIFTGVMVSTFLIYHLSHFTLFLTNPQYAHYEDTPPMHAPRHDVYRMVYEAFSNPAVVVFYVLSMVVIYVHLSHGLQSLMQTLGFTNHRTRSIYNVVGPVTAGLIVAGFLSVPIGVLSGFLKPSGESSTISTESKGTIVR